MLSGGQRQRLALARGALAAQGSSLLQLDEPTSALDPQAEGRVFDRMFAAFPSACIVASVHLAGGRIDRDANVVFCRPVLSTPSSEESHCLCGFPHRRLGWVMTTLPAEAHSFPNSWYSSSRNVAHGLLWGKY
ncbi:hypothetical protein [Cupriavidus pinatubonensis]|uniref:hypothetical protein n=1 Tax=Cupriavidus pinatubonensis TaxID=248026 RepID=UPI0035946206